MTSELVPFDILHRIFDDFVGEDEQQLFSLSWTRLLLVCRQWHSIGLLSPRLWSYISFEPTLSVSEVPSSEGFADIEEDVRRVRTQLSRAGTWPLTIRYKPLPWTYPNYFQELGSSLFWNPEAVQCLSVRGDYLRLNETIQEICRHTHLRLHTLELQHCKSELNMANIIALSELLAQKLPSLRSLVLRDVRCDWSCIQNLRSLKISYAVLLPQPYHLQDIVTALRRCPELEELHLGLPFWRSSGDSEPIPEPLPLPHLRDLLLRGPVHICAPLYLSITTLARGATVNISFNGVHPRDERNLERVESRIGEHLRRQDAHSIWCLTWGNSAVDGRIAVARTSNKGNINGSANPDIHFHASTKRPPLGLSNCLASWPLEDVTHLDMRSISICASGVWRVLLASLPALHTIAIRVERSPIEELLLVSMERLAQGHLPVANLYFDASELLMSNAYHALRDERKDSCTKTLERLLIYCAQAEEAGAPLQEVNLVDPHCHLIPEDVDWKHYHRSLVTGFRYNGIMHRRVDGGMI